MTTTNYSMCMLFICLFASCGTGEKRTDESIRIKVAEVEMSVPSSEREFSFISKPFKETELSFRVGGPIDRFEVYAGNYYQRGDIIAEIDSRDFRIRKERAEAIYNQAKAEFERIRVLYEKIIYLPALMKKHVRIILLLRLLLRQRQMSYMIRS